MKSTTEKSKTNRKVRHSLIQRLKTQNRGQENQKLQSQCGLTEGQNAWCLLKRGNRIRRAHEEKLTTEERRFWNLR